MPPRLFHLSHKYNSYSQPIDRDLSLPGLENPAPWTKSLLSVKLSYKKKSKSLKIVLFVKYRYTCVFPLLKEIGKCHISILLVRTDSSGRNLVTFLV